MKRKNISRITATIICVITLIGIFALPISANSAQTWFYGVDSSGAIMPDTESPVIVEKELLTFNINEFPSNYYTDEEEYLQYSASVSAEYTFYNPSDYTVTAKLLFPFGNSPSYSDGYFDEKTGKYLPFDDTGKFDITLNGEAIEKKIRHTLSDLYSQFELESDLALIVDGFADDDFYKSDLTVTRYKFEVSGVDTQKYTAATVGFDISEGLGNYRICFPDQNGSHLQKDGDMRLNMFVMENGTTFELYVFGEPLSVMPEWQAYKDGGVEDREKIDGRVELTSTETMTFKEFALSNRSLLSEVSENDWYNALLAEIRGDEKYSGYPIIYLNRFFNNFDKCFMRWYEYEITLAPGERIINTVTAPLYPSIDMGYSPAIFKYTYLLSPAKTWKSFGELKIVINTPYCMTKANFEGYEKIESSYLLTLDGLPEGELEFTLSTSESPVKRKSSGNFTDYNIPGILAVAGIFALGGAAIGGAVALIIYKCKKRKMKKSQSDAEND